MAEQYYQCKKCQKIVHVDKISRNMVCCENEEEVDKSLLDRCYHQLKQGHDILKETYLWDDIKRRLKSDNSMIDRCLYQVYQEKNIEVGTFLSDDILKWGKEQEIKDEIEKLIESSK